MDRSRRTAPPVDDVPASSRLIVRPRKNRRRPVPRSVWSRMPRPNAIADACGRALRRSVPALVATCVALLACGGIWLGYRFVTGSPRFAIRAIEIRGADRLTADEVRAALPVSLGDNVFTASLDGVTARLRLHPWVASASAHRILPDTLVIEIREHAAAAIAMLGEPYLVDANGHPFKHAQLELHEAEGLPVITGIERSAYRTDPVTTAATIKTALAALARWRTEPGRPAIGEVHIDPLGALVLRTYDRGVAIELGALADAAVDPRLTTFDAAWAELSELERARARTIHLDARHDHVTVAFAKDGK
jgi:cell division protein FtsQ